MESLFIKQLDKLYSTGTASFLQGALRGIEKEGLRVDYAGSLSQENHPQGLGSALTNRHVTTDFSEALLELITPVLDAPEAAIAFLEDLHHFTYLHLDQELIWAGSMPCRIPDADLIPIARFGTSNSGRLKHIYRVGLEHRYGKMMQTLAGIHYNFSLPDEFWEALQELQESRGTLQTFRSASYFRMIRNFRRHSWLLLYLFGASPALCDSFVKGKSHDLEALHEQTLYLPYATSLRMSDFGYSPEVQSSLGICFNHLKTYIDSLNKAIHTPYPPYTEIGVRAADGTYRQLNDTILQIENEYYSDIRPKRVPRYAEKPLQALLKRGVEYVEVRHTDINPFLPAGIDARQARFIDTFLISCLLMSHEEVSPAECKIVTENTRKVIRAGRKPGLMLDSPRGPATLLETGRRLLNTVEKTAGLLDEVHTTKLYSQSVDAQREKLEEVSLTPSAQVLEALKESGASYSRWMLSKSREHKEYLLHSPVDAAVVEKLTLEALESREKQRRLEADDTLDFDQFLAQYLTS